MDSITKPSITRIARKAGVKSISDDCYDKIRSIIDNQLSDIIKAALIVNSEYNTKTLMPEHIYDAFHLRGYNVTQSQCLSTTNCAK